MSPSVGRNEYGSASVRCPVGVGDLELVAQRQRRARDDALEQPGAGGLVRARRLAAGSHGDALGVGPEGAHDHAAVRRVRAEHACGSCVVAREAFESLSRRSSSRRAIPATGIRTQSGRLLSS